MEVPWCVLPYLLRDAPVAGCSRTRGAGAARPPPTTRPFRAAT